MITAVNSNQNLNIDNKSSSDAPKRKNGEVASNIKAYAGNMQGVLDTLKNNGVKINNEQSYLSINRFVVNEHDLAGLEDITTPHQDTVFTDLYSKEETLMDKGRFLALAKEIMDAKGEKSIDFDLKGVNAGKLKTKPLESNDYSKGAPFMLSCKTKHCDFPGAVGGNYPTAEYLSDKGSSVKIFNSAEEYVGHYNIWKQEDGDFCIGTIAMIDNHGTSKYSPKDLKNLVAAQAISLLENNPQANSVSIGMGGHNLKNMFPGKFDKNTDGYKALGSLRHADLSTASQGLVKELENITSYKVRTDSPIIANQKEIGMMPDQRKDFKNALVVVDKGNLNQQKRVLENFEQTKNQSSSRARTQHENGVSQKLQRTEAYQSDERRTVFMKTILNNSSIQGCNLVNVNGMDALLRVDNASNREQTKQDLQELTKDLQGIKIENGFRDNELKVKISYNTSQKPARATDWTSDLKMAIRSDAVNYFISKNKISGCETSSVNGKDVFLKVSKEQKTDVINAFNASANSMGITFKDSPKDNQVRVTVEI